MSNPVCRTPRARCIVVLLSFLVFSATPLSGIEQPENPDLEQRGRAAFEQCAACHTLELGGDTLVGPNLYGIFGRAVASIQGFAYSESLRTRGGVWDEDALNRYIARPKLAVPGNNMPFVGMTSPRARGDLIAWLKTNPRQYDPAESDFQALLVRDEVSRGAQVARSCMVCHTASEDMENNIGPNLWGVVGRPIASAPGFDYSERIMRREGVWTPSALNGFFMENKAFDQGSHRAFSRLKRPSDRAALISWLKTLNSNSDHYAR